MRLENLNCNSTKVQDLSPIAEAPLQSLYCAHTWVTALSLPKSNRLRDLQINATKVRDLSFLRGTHLEKLYFDFGSDRDAEVLHSITTLETINGVAAKEFWKRVAAGEIPK